MSTAASDVDVPVLRSRLDRAGVAAANAGVDALLVAPGSDLRYLLGAAGGSFERLTCLVVPAAGSGGVATLVVPKLEQPGYAQVPTGELGVAVATWVDGENPYKLAHGALGVGASQVAVTDMMPALHDKLAHGALGVGASQVAVTDMMPALHVLGLRDEAPTVHQVLGGPVLRELRMRKDAAELAALRKAGAAIDRVHARVREWLRPGRTEAEVGADIAAAIVAEGHTEAAFVIVGSGPNGASPHHEVSDRVIEAGDVVVVDIGGPVAEGYNSDSTRTYVLGEPREADVAATFAVLQRAQSAAVAAVAPGVTAEAVDQAARQVIADAGFGEFFIHRTGHGIGLDVHEDPYIVTGNGLVLEPGMAFSVEPGIYLPGRWGARIEDIVLVTEDGVESVNNQPHELVAL